MVFTSASSWASGWKCDRMPSCGSWWPYTETRTSALIRAKTRVGKYKRRREDTKNTHNNSCKVILMALFSLTDKDPKSLSNNPHIGYSILNSGLASELSKNLVRTKQSFSYHSYFFPPSLPQVHSHSTSTAALMLTNITVFQCKRLEVIFT